MQEVPRPSPDEYGKDPSWSWDISSRFTLGHSQASVRRPWEPQPLWRWTIKTGCAFCIANRTGRRTARFESDLFTLCLVFTVSRVIKPPIYVCILSPSFATFFFWVIYFLESRKWQDKWLWSRSSILSFDFCWENEPSLFQIVKNMQINEGQA